jgi:soluble lytic murein transglycosylase-like protein
VKRLSATIAVLALAGAASARAEIAVLANGQTLKVTARRVEADRIYLSLKDGGEVGLLPAQLRGFVPDEVIDEVLAPAAAGTDVRALAIATARRHGLDPNLVLAVVAVESGFQPDAVSNKGAQGLMQLMPATARELGVADALDPAQNLDGGTRYLRMLVARYGGDLGKALAAYNAGPGAVTRHGGVPPYRETHHYIDRVLRERARAGKAAAEAR